MLSELTKARIRKHLGVPVAGLNPTGSALGFRFNAQIGTLEYRLINLQPIEESQLTGNPQAYVQITGSPQVGDVVSVSIVSSDPSVPPGAAIAYTVTEEDLAAPIPLQSISQNWAAAITLANQGYVGDYGIPPQTKPLGGTFFYTGTLVITPAPASTSTFMISVSTTGNTIVYVEQQGQQVPPMITFAETGQTVYGYVAICDYLETRIALSSDLVKYQKADVVNFRMNELAERQNIYDYWCDQLADFFGIRRFPMGSRPSSPGSAGFTGAVG